MNNDELQNVTYPGEGKVPADLPAGPLDRIGSGKTLALGGTGRSAAKQSRFAVTPGGIREAFVYRWKSSLAIGLIFAAIGAGIAWATYKPKYTAITSLRINFNKQSVLPGPRFGDENAVGKLQKNEVQIIKSREILQKVIGNEDVKASETIRNQDNPISWLEKELQANFVPGTDFFRIGLTGERPEDLALIVNTIRTEYARRYKNSATLQQNQLFESLLKVIANSEKKIEEKQKLLAGIVSEGGGIADAQVLTLQQKIALDEYGEARKEFNALEREIRNQKAFGASKAMELAALEGKSSPVTWGAVAPLVTFASVIAEAEAVEKIPAADIVDSLEKHPRVLEAEYAISQIQTKIKDYSKTLTGVNPRLEQMKAELEAAQNHVQKVKADLRPDVARRLLHSVRKKYAAELNLTQARRKVAEELRNDVDKNVQELDRKVKNIGTRSFKIESERSTLEQQQAVLKTLRAEKERLEVEQSNDRHQIIDEQVAEAPTVNQASLLQSGSLYALGGLLLGVLGVSYFEARLHRVHRPAQVDQELGIQILGILPLLAKNSSRRYGESASVNESLPDVLFADAVNALCARLLCDDRLTANTVLMVTSATEDEGKTMLATQLAAGLARLGRRTLLLDCDFRNSRCREQFGLPPGPGLANILCGDAELADVIHTMPDSEARVLTAGQGDGEVIKALHNGKFAALLARLRQDFDCIIVDSAPTPVVSDGLLIGKLSDGVLLVVRPKVSKSAEVVAAFDQLAALRIPILGSVVNAHLTTASGAYYK